MSAHIVHSGIKPLEKHHTGSGHRGQSPLAEKRTNARMQSGTRRGFSPRVGSVCRPRISVHRRILCPESVYSVLTNCTTDRHPS